MSINDPKYQEMYHLLVEQIRNRPEQVVANINCLLLDTDIEIRLLRADIHKRYEEQRKPVADILHIGYLVNEA